MKNYVTKLVDAVKEFFAIVGMATKAAQMYKNQRSVAKVKKSLLEA